MARKPRIHRSSAFYHVMLRGNNGQQIFFSDQDKIRFCLLIQEGVERFGHRVHGFCLMSNHIHLVVETANISLSKIIQHLAFRYARYFNRKEARIGHLFQGRFKSILVEAEHYLSELVRYVHLNPVRAGIVKLPEDYFWSSHKTYLGLDKIGWIAEEWVLRKFHHEKQPARLLYKEFIQRGISEKARSEFRLGNNEHSILGSESFVKDMLAEAHQDKNVKFACTVEELVSAVSQVLGVSPVVLTMPGKQRTSSIARGITAYIAKTATNLTLKELATFFGRDLSTVSALAITMQQKLFVDESLAQAIEEIKERLQIPISQA